MSNKPEMGVLDNILVEIYTLILALLADTLYNRINPLETEFFLTNIQASSSYLTGNTLRPHYKPQPVNAVWGNSLCLLWEPYGTHRYTVWAESI
jgi:hypothetical protein